MKYTATEILQKLERRKEYCLTFNCRIQIGDMSVNLAKYDDVVGNIMQEWVEGWLKKNGVEYAPNDNTQMPPDFYLDPDDKTHNLMEVKAFNRSATPGFDIADFKSYINEIVEKPYMLHSQYLIFGYQMSDEGIVTIKDLWLQNIWEITRSSKQWAINVQYKNKMIQKIRPCVWYSKKKTKFPNFKKLEHYLSAIEETIYNYAETRPNAKGWKEKMEKSYKAFYGKEIRIPRWMDIENEYHL